MDISLRIVIPSLLLFVLFIVDIREGHNSCLGLQCGNGPPIRFPFRLKDRQLDQHSGYPGLGCTDAAPRPTHSSPTRRRGRDAADRASVPRRATWQVPNRADAAEIGANAAEIDADAAQIGPTRSVSACIGRNGRVRPKFKKKKKKGANAPFD